jgi:hypothetical protein
VHAKPSHWLHEISIPKTVHHHFWPGLMVLLGEEEKLENMKKEIKTLLLTLRA